MAEVQLVKVRLKQSLASPTREWERGDEYECPLAEARRMVERGVAVEIQERPLPKATKAELEAARVLHVQTVGAIPGERGARGKAKGNRARVEPATATVPRPEPEEEI